MIDKRTRNAGRPVRSQIRDNILSILSVLGPRYGYDIHKIHEGVFFPCTREVVYYHLRKGVALELLTVKNDAVAGDYSWGKRAEKKLYAITTTITVDPAMATKIRMTPSAHSKSPPQTI